MKRLLNLLRSLLIGIDGLFYRTTPEWTPPPKGIRREWQDLECSEADYRVRTIGSVRYTYSGPMVALNQGGMLNRTSTWKTVTDRDLRNRCVEGTGWEESET